MLRSVLVILIFSAHGLAVPKKKGHGELIPIPKNMLHLQQKHDLDSFEDENEESFHYEYEEEYKEEFHFQNGSHSHPAPHNDSSSSHSHNDSSIIPSVLPEGDPSNYALPIFLEEPSDAFAVKSQSAVLQCRVAHALGVHFQCNSEVVEPSGQKDLVEPESGARYTEATVEISREKIEEFFGDYNCACVAISRKGSVVSRYALVSYAYLKKEFEVPPYSQQVSKGKQVEMRCHPPRGRPLPSIYWAVNGRRIDPSFDKNYIVTGEGHLIIVSTKLANFANYTCVAHNIANVRISDPATVTVYIDGGWSSWSRWTSCSSNCGKGIQKRTRICDSPSPINGGQPCSGSPIEKKNCVSDCPGSVYGGWTQWTSWSSCSPECFHHRRRTCSNPSPSKGGKYCIGEDLESLNCTDGFCQETRQLVMYGNNAEEKSGASLEVTEEDTSSSSLDVTLYIVLSLAFIVFSVVILIIFRLLRRKSNHPNGYTLTSTDYGYGSSSDEGKKPGLGYSPDITQQCPPPPIVNGPPPQLHPHHLTSSGMKSATTVCYDTSPSDSIGKPPKSESCSSTGTSNERGKGTLVQCPRRIGPFPLHQHPFPAFQPIPPPLAQLHPLPLVVFVKGSSTTDPLFTVWNTVTHSGARMTLPDSGIALTIPPGALHSSTDLFIGVIHDAVHYPPPRLSGRETLLSPLVVIGPPEAALALKKPIILSMPHCGSLRHGNWTVSALHRSDDEGWKRVVTLGSETINTPVYIQLDVNTCHIVTDILGGFALSGESSHGAIATKSLRLAAFAQEGHRPHTDLTVRVYCLQDTEDALSYVSESEKRYNGFLLDEPVSFLFKDASEEDRSHPHLCINVESLGRGWSTSKGTEYLEVPFNHIWNTSNPTLHCSFTFKATIVTSVISFSLGVSQKGVNSLKSHLAVNADLSTTSSFSSLRKPPNPCPITNPLQSNKQVTFRLPLHSVSALSRLLDSPNSQGNDWRLLAERLNVHRYITYFATRPSPTECILHLWEARNRESSASNSLHSILKVMGRYDAASVLERDLDIR
ncbi:UNC5 [Lepeophtheirus salmonis]|uniref:Netrin receptor UNC5 n=1 Tax=Lepeophtheirus salmonis TaxID=72036 RepID=A0A7R8H054_LEPSM|nr:UNC5 [Lepeophtheirus salmonis]CAF2779126.1 UNC5 [Lepeophtheirus salmonis]